MFSCHFWSWLDLQLVGKAMERACVVRRQTLKFAKISKCNFLYILYLTKLFYLASKNVNQKVIAIKLCTSLTCAEL